MGQNISISAQGLSDTGRVRSSNQDCYLVNDAQNLYIVADGMGGHAGGEIASSLCVMKINEQLSKVDFANYSKAEIYKSLKNAVNAASASIFDRALEQTSLSGMGTTASALMFINDRAYFAHVGDSRVYLIRGGFIYQLSHDHSLVVEQLEAGILTPEDAKNHQLRNIITRCVGYKEHEDVDVSDVEVFSEDLFLLCSDGLHSKISDQEISNMTQEKKLKGLKLFIDLANSRGGEDNISLIIVAIQKG